MKGVMSFLLIGSFLLGLQGLHAEENSCDASVAVSSNSIVSNARGTCCPRSAKREKTCFRQALKRVRKTTALLSKSVVRPAVRELRDLRTKSCDEVAAVESQCTNALSTSLDESVNTISAKACDLSLKDDRQNRLKKFRRSVKAARPYLNKEFVASVRQAVKVLLKSEACGAGGKEVTHGCSRIISPRDGANTGNVYKLSDHAPNYPVFVTHNGSRSGTAINERGEVLDTLRYTGLANPDPAGLRHHYRLNRSCRSLPAGYYLKLGGTCYVIDSPCSRID